MRIRNWEIGWSRNVAIGVVWTKRGDFAFFFLGFTAFNYQPQSSWLVQPKDQP